MAWDNGEINTAVGWGDISHATGSGGPPYPMGNMVDFNNPTIINPLAKYKPVRHSSWGILSEADRRSTRYGFGASVPTWYAPSPGSSGAACPKANWSYLRPRGIAYNEPYRGLDFLKEPGSTIGYNSHMASPIFLAQQGTPEVGENYGFAILFNGSAGSAQTGVYWDADEGLSIRDLLESASDLYRHLLTVLLYDNDDKTWNLVTFNTTLESASQSASFIAMLYASAGYESGVYHPAVPFLNESSHTGHSVTVVLGLRAGTPGSDAYSVITSNSTCPDVYSLGFADGCDRFTVEFGNAISIMGLTGGIVNDAQNPIVLTKYKETTYGGYDYVVYQINSAIHGSFSTPSNWGRTEQRPDHRTVGFDITMSNMAGVLGTASEPSSTGGASFYASANFDAGISGYRVQLIAPYGVTQYLWMLKNVPVNSRYVKFDITATAADTGESKNLTGAIAVATS